MQRLSSESLEDSVHLFYLIMHLTAFHFHRFMYLKRGKHDMRHDTGSLHLMPAKSIEAKTKLGKWVQMNVLRAFLT